MYALRQAIRHGSRSYTAYLRSPQSAAALCTLAPYANPPALGQPAALRTILSDCWGQLQQLWDSVLRAVPKKKTSHSKKRMRSANKGLKNRTDILPCPGCGRVKMMGHVCRHCLRDIRHQLASGSSTPSSTALA